MTSPALRDLRHELAALVAVRDDLRCELRRAERAHYRAVAAGVAEINARSDRVREVELAIADATAMASAARRAEA